MKKREKTWLGRPSKIREKVIFKDCSEENNFSSGLGQKRECMQEFLLNLKETLKETILYICLFKRNFKRNYPGNFKRNFKRNYYIERVSLKETLKLKETVIGGSCLGQT